MAKAKMKAESVDAVPKKRFVAYQQAPRRWIVRRAVESHREMPDGRTGNVYVRFDDEGSGARIQDGFVFESEFDAVTAVRTLNQAKSYVGS